MLFRPATESRLFELLRCGALIAIAVGSATAAAAQRGSEGVPIPCAILEKFSGAVRILDPSRTHLVETEKKAGIPCGGWLATDLASAQISHRDGYTIHLSENTFVRFIEPNPDGKSTVDGIILYRGQIYLATKGGAPEARVITTNARARIPSGQAILVYNASEDETQVITLDGAASLENRFQAVRRVAIAPGEASSMNFSQLRTVPSAPRAMALSSLRGKLSELFVPDKETSLALRKAKARSERIFASEASLKTEEETPSYPDEADAKPVRSLASKSRPKPAAKAVAHAPADTQGHFVRKVSGGEEAGVKILFPNESYGKSKSAELEVTDPAAKLDRAASEQEEKERRKLIEELSQIKVE